MLPLSAMPGSARIWIFPLLTGLEPSGRSILEQRLRRILEEWAAHGAPIRGAAEIVTDRFIVIAADEDQVRASGCSIDSLARQVREAVASAGSNISPQDAVFYRVDGEIVTVSRETFGNLVAAGKISTETPVFDTSITLLSQYNSGQMELPFCRSWHSRAF